MIKQIHTITPECIDNRAEIGCALEISKRLEKYLIESAKAGEGRKTFQVTFETVEKKGKQKCRVCGCTDDDCRQCIEAQGKPCHWVEEDLCSRCKTASDLIKKENEKYNKPCPYNPKVMCVQMPCDPEDDNYCDDGCPNRKGGE